MMASYKTTPLGERIVGALEISKMKRPPTFAKVKKGSQTTKDGQSHRQNNTFVGVYCVLSFILSYFAGGGGGRPLCLCPLFFILYLISFILFFLSFHILLLVVVVDHFASCQMRDRPDS